jgi:hypothetical protein
MKSKNTNNELKEAPLLKSIPAHDPFVVPDGFFERFPHQLQDRLREPEGFLSRVVRALSNAPVIRWSSAGLAMMLLMFGASILLKDPPKGDDQAFVVKMGSEELDADHWNDSEVMWYTDDPNELMAYSGDDLRAEDLLHYLENEDLPLELLSEEL